jgi:hypothetical protein
VPHFEENTMSNKRARIAAADTTPTASVDESGVSFYALFPPVVTHMTLGINDRMLEENEQHTTTAILYVDPDTMDVTIVRCKTVRDWLADKNYTYTFETCVFRLALTRHGIFGLSASRANDPTRVLMYDGVNRLTFVYVARTRWTPADRKLLLAPRFYSSSVPPYLVRGWSLSPTNDALPKLDGYHAMTSHWLTHAFVVHQAGAVTSTAVVDDNGSGPVLVYARVRNVGTNAVRSHGAYPVLHVKHGNLVATTTVCEKSNTRASRPTPRIGLLPDETTRLVCDDSKRVDRGRLFTMVLDRKLALFVQTMDARYSHSLCLAPLDDPAAATVLVPSVTTFGHGLYGMGRDLHNLDTNRVSACITKDGHVVVYSPNVLTVVNFRALRAAFVYGCVLFARHK